MIFMLIGVVVILGSSLMLAVRRYQRAERQIVAHKKTTSELEQRLADEQAKREIVWASDLFDEHQRDGEDEFENSKEFYCCSAEPFAEIMVELGLSEKRIDFNRSYGPFGVCSESTLVCYKDFVVKSVPELISLVVEALGKKVSRLEKAEEAFASLRESLS